MMQCDLDDSIEHILTEDEQYLQDKLNTKDNIIAAPFENNGLPIHRGGGAAGGAASSKTNKKTNEINERDERHLKHLDLKEADEMNQRHVQVLDGDIQTDWYIFESHNYNLKSWKYEGGQTDIVSRRFSDFEWLREELALAFPGYFLPPLPQKGIFSKLDPKIEYLNSKKLEFMDYRRDLLTFFLKDLLAHRELKYSPLLKLFLITSDQSFAPQKQQYISNRLSTEEHKEGLLQNILSTGFSIFTKAVGTTKVERRVTDSLDDEYKDKLDHYTRQFNQLRNLADSIQVIVNSKKEQAENMSKISSLISQLKSEDNQIKGDLDKITQKAGCAEIAQIGYLYNDILVPIKQQVAQLESCLETINSRETLATTIFNLKRDVTSLEQQLKSSVNDELRDQRSKLSQNERRMNLFLVNFKHNEQYFLYHFNYKVEELIKLFDQHRRKQNSELAFVWNPDY